MGFIAYLLISLALAVLSYLLMPKPKLPSRNVEKLQAPTADMGRPIPVVFGEVLIKAPNTLWFGDVETKMQKVKL